jgi:Domain of unknown function (DUF5666)
MGYLGTRSTLVAGVIALAIGLGAGMIFGAQWTGAAFAQGGDTEFEGYIEALPPAGVVGAWRVSGRTVIVTEATEIDRDGQTLAQGLWVEIEGTDQPDGSIVASEIEVEEADDDDGGPLASRDDDDGGGAGDDD